jgi:hypothetical protein
MKLIRKQMNKIKRTKKIKRKKKKKRKIRKKKIKVSQNWMLYKINLKTK